MHSEPNLPGVWRSWLRLAGDLLVRRPVEGIAAILAGVRQAATPLVHAAAGAVMAELSQSERHRISDGIGAIVNGVQALAAPLLLGALLLVWCRPIVFCVLAVATLCVAA